MLVGARVPEAGSLMVSQPSALGSLARPLFKQKLAYADLVKVPHGCQHCCVCQPACPSTCSCSQLEM